MTTEQERYMEAKAEYERHVGDAIDCVLTSAECIKIEWLESASDKSFDMEDLAGMVCDLKEEAQTLLDLCDQVIE